MTPEEYKRIKEAEKEHLRALKKLKEKLREVNRQKSVADAMENIQKAPGEDILNTHEEMVDRLAMDTIQQEARLEMALSDSDMAEADPPVESTEAEPEPPQQSDAELQKIRAQELVRQIKMQMGLAEAKRKQEAVQPVTSETAGDEAPEADGEVSEKKQESPQPEDLPEKTIGRIPRKGS